jgi:uncharacterized protein
MYKRVFDEALIKQYIQQDPEMTLFFYGDLESCGTHGDNCQFFINYIDEEIDGIILMWEQVNFQFYSQKESFNINDVVTFLKDKNIVTLSGKYDLLKRLEPLFLDLVLRITYLAKCSKVICKANKSSTIQVREMNESDANAHALLISSIDEFKENKSANTTIEDEKKSFVRALKYGGHYIGVFQNNDLLAMAGTTANSSLSGMVVGVCTKKDERGKGYASLAVNTLCELSFKKGQQFLCLFYNNPIAGRIYHSLGFMDVGQYGMLVRK